MALQKWFGALLSGGLVAILSYGCSSGSNGAGPAADAGNDGSIHKMLDGGGITVTDSGGGSDQFDMTTGKTCTTNADCVGTDGGPGFNMCSNQFAYMVTGQQVTLWPTPICMLPPPTGGSSFGNCDPAPNDGSPLGYPHFCDGPDDPSSPGICLALDSTPEPNRGVCLPKCTFGTDTAPQQGCPGADTCVSFTYLQDPQSLAVTGYGFCQGTCQKDADCAGVGTGFVCQTDTGYCTMAKKTRTKAIGAACTMDDVTTGACNCDYNTDTNIGFCTSSCVTGGTNSCPAGWVCDAGFSGPLDFGPGTATVPITGQPTGMTGSCRPTCTNPVGPDGGVLDAGTVTTDAGETDAGDAGSAPAPAGDAGSGCPSTATCQLLTQVGPACFP